MSRPLGFYVPYCEDDCADGAYSRLFAKEQFIPLTAVETIYQVNGGYWELRTISGRTYSFGTLDDGISPDVPTITELVGVCDATEEQTKGARG